MRSQAWWRTGSMRSDGTHPEPTGTSGEARDTARAERVLHGLGVAPGLAIGIAHISDPVTLSIPSYTLLPDDIPAEIERFEAALAVSRHQLAKLKDKSASLHGPAAEDIGYLLDAHLAMLTQSRLVRGVLARVRDQLVNAESAVWAEISALAESFSVMDDAYLAARAEDVRVVGSRLIRNLTQTPFASIGKVPHGTVLLAEELTPADTALIDPASIVAFATTLGGADSHTAITARALGIPAVLGCVGLLQGVCEGDQVLVNGFAGTVTINPCPATLGQYEAQQDSIAREQRQLKLIGQLPSVTQDGVAIMLQANLELPRELAPALEAGAEGIGLVRTEFLFMDRDEPPDENEQVETLVALVRGMQGRPVTIRTLDIGGDKLAFSLHGSSAESANPALGLRAIRFSLKHRSFLEVQLAAILRAAVEGPVRILLPMISTLGQLRETKAILQSVAERLRLAGVAVPEHLPPLGIMIEVPAAALVADAFAAESDFFAIGTNDLTQYTLAIDRGDDQVADLYNPLHPAVLRLIRFTVDAADRAGIPVSLCGELAGDARYTALLLGLGIRTLSMASASLPRVKQKLRGLTLAHAEALACNVMAEREESVIADLLERG